MPTAAIPVPAMTVLPFRFQKNSPSSTTLLVYTITALAAPAKVPLRYLTITLLLGPHRL